MAHLRDKKGDSAVLGNSKKSPQPPKVREVVEPKKRLSERRLATDSFILFAYSLLAVAIISQIVILISLDI